MNEQDKRLFGLTTFIQLEKHARSAESIQRLQFVIANETFKLIRYRQAAVWSCRFNGGIRLVTISGTSQLDPNAPFVQWLQSLLSEKIKADVNSSYVISRQDVAQSLLADWDEFINGDILITPIRQNNELLGGMAIIRSDPWAEAEISLIDMLMGAYAHAWYALLQHNRRWKKTGFLHVLNSRRVRYALLVSLLVVMFLPVTQTVLAPASVVPLSPKAVTSPLEGVIGDIVVKPNQAVAGSQPLFVIDDTRIRNQATIAEKSYEVAKAEHFRAVQKSFGSADVKSDVALLKARMDEKASELEYYRSLLDKTVVRSPAEGVVIFTNSDDWIGKPVVTGEKVMELARTDEVQVEIWLPVDDAIALSEGSRVLFFLNTDPVNPLTASLSRLSYQPKVNDSNILAFRVLAHLDGQQALPRLGLQGTAKLHGQSVSLVYYLLRRPISRVRQWIGL